MDENRVRHRVLPTRRSPLPSLLATLCLAGVFSFLPGGPCVAQDPPTHPIGVSEQHEIVERIIDLLQERYVFPEAVGVIADSLHADLAAGVHDGITDASDYADALSGRLRELSDDGHLWVTHQPQSPGQAEATGGEAPEDRRRRLARSNFGLPRVEVLPGNVGYLDIRQFIAPELAGDAARAAMDFVGDVEAMIIDVRRSQGGSPAMVALLASYLFDSEPVHLFDLHLRPADRTDQYWTLSYLPTERLVDQPVYILTAESTFSAGEGLAYILKHLGRATVVGERTAGGANPGALHRLNERFAMFVAEGRVISPVTGGNWQGSGVEPEVAVSDTLALTKAYELALEQLRERTSDPERVLEIDRLIAELGPDGAWLRNRR